VPGPPLVTGATGFAGGHLVRLLLTREPCVAAWGHAGGRPLSESKAHERISWSYIDLLDGDSVTAALAQLRPSAIYHLAGMADVHAAWRSAAPALRVNALGTYHLLDACRTLRLDIPVLVTGSALVYKPSSQPIDEESPLAPASPYGISKLAQELIALRATWDRVFVARPFNHAGPGQSDAYVTSSFARQIAEIEVGLRDPVLHVGNLESRRDITDVRDTVRAYESILQRGIPGRPYNVCCGKAYRVADLMRMLVASARVDIQIQTDPDRLRPSDTPVVLGDFGRLERETGWRPVVPIEQTLADLLDYWRGVVNAGKAAR
jgi:GDP-4-dehydro-6-deoxy-D-mannose reductase